MKHQIVYRLVSASDCTDETWIELSWRYPVELGCVALSKNGLIDAIYRRFVFIMTTKVYTVRKSTTRHKFYIKTTPIHR